MIDRRNLTVQRDAASSRARRTARQAGLGLLLSAATMLSAACADDASVEAASQGVEVLAQATATFPRADEAVNVERAGPYKFASYTQGLANRAYNSAIAFYPTDATPPFAAVAFSPGFTATKEQYQEFLGPLYASHGIVLLLTTPTSTGDLPQQRSDDLKAALEVLKAENARAGSPLQGKIATDRLGVTGHSMGGGGTLWAANSLGNQIKVAIPLQPWQPGQRFDKITAATLFISAQNDTIAGNAQNSSVHYASIPSSVPKYFVEFAGASHFLTSNNRGSNYPGQSKYMVAFLKAYLEDDTRYLEVLNASKPSEISRLEKSK
ncbi:MAG: dienelactone hydrolase family protein [Polyangiales bacterium]